MVRHFHRVIHTFDEKIMNRIATILAVLIISAVVAQAQLIWPTKSEGIIFKKYGPKIETVKPPASFTVTPVEVSEMFAPRKFMIMIYANDTHYFVTRHGRKQTFKKAQLFGVRINGKTGVVDKKSLNLKVLKTYEKTRKRRHPIGIGTPLTGRPSHTTNRTDHVVSGSAVIDRFDQA